MNVTLFFPKVRELLDSSMGVGEDGGLFKNSRTSFMVLSYFRITYGHEYIFFC